MVRIIEGKNQRQMIAAETLEILEAGHYTAPSGRTVSIAASRDQARDRTRLYRPDDLSTRRQEWPARQTEIEVTGETSLAASRRLDDPACLNFASAKNPGGGFRSGAHAQEEGLARSSALYPTLLRAREYYDFHRAQRDPLYSDHMIYSPRVPVFRDDSGTLLEEPYEVSFVTAPAPNRGALRDPEADVAETLRTRAAKVLWLMRASGHTEIVLGAWGCGVFRNDPDQVASTFAALLAGEFAGTFAKVVFAVWDTDRGAPRLTAFQRAFE
jgi:uncharacterized protein (TIGR02452 family)